MDRWVYERFGSREGCVRYFQHALLSAIGRYKAFPRVFPDKNRRLVFICSGNICRSPLGEVYARSLGWEAASCGLHCGENYPADPRAREFAMSNGLDLSQHQTVNITNFEFQQSDLVVVMEPVQLESFRIATAGQYQAVLAGSYRKPANPYIHDPYNCCRDYFDRCGRSILESVRTLCGQK